MCQDINVGVNSFILMMPNTTTINTELGESASSCHVGHQRYYNTNL